MLNQSKYSRLKSGLNNMRPFPKNNLIVLYICVILIITYILVSNPKINIRQHLKSYSNARLKFWVYESEEDSEEQIADQKYRINTNSCKISDLPVFDEETRHLFPLQKNNETKYDCSERNYKIKITRFYETWIHVNWSAVGYQPFCYYRKLSRGTNDHDLYYGRFNGPIKSNKLNLDGYFFVHIVCYKNSTKQMKTNEYNLTYIQEDKELIHDEIIPLIPEINKMTDSDVPNVLLLAIDATSYVNFYRHFSRTQTLLKKYKFFELRGYNKVGANTFPNMIPFLTGHHSIELISDEKLRTIYFDDWPIIWKDYAKRGFVTTFLEEMSWCGLFNFNLRGFKDKPTDYQLRPFHMEIMKQKYNYYCYSGRTETENCLDWTYDFVRAMYKRNQKYFAYISISEMSHDWIEAGHYLDVPYYQLLSKLFNENLLDNTLVFFFSDHGFRYGPLRQTHTGEVENRLPFMFIHLPDNFDSNYAENLRQNQYRLTTPFDIHATLKHLIEGKPNQNLTHGQSLFEDVLSENRDCNSSSIPDMFCSCNEDIEIQDFDIIKPNITLPKIVDKINSFTDKVRTKCAKFSVQTIHKLYFRKVNRKDKEYELGNSLIYLIQLYVNPGMALFETVLRGFEQNTRFEIVGEISRINLYGKQAHCLNDKLLNNYCFCKDLL